MLKGVAHGEETDKGRTSVPGAEGRGAREVPKGSNSQRGISPEKTAEGNSRKVPPHRDRWSELGPAESELRFFFKIIRRPPRSTLFPSTPRFRSERRAEVLENFLPLF